MVEHPGEDFCFVGRITPEKGILDAIEIARLTGRRLLVAAKVPTRRSRSSTGERSSGRRSAGADVTILGELSETGARPPGRLEPGVAIIPSAWPEPFGLVVIEALACGTPVLARRSGAIPEIVRDGIDGFIGDDAQQLAYFDARLDGLDRAEIRAVRAGTLLGRRGWWTATRPCTGELARLAPGRPRATDQSPPTRTIQRPRAVAGDDPVERHVEAVEVDLGHVPAEVARSQVRGQPVPQAAAARDRHGDRVHPEQRDAAQDEREDRRLELRAAGIAAGRDGAAGLERPQDVRQRRARRPRPRPRPSVPTRAACPRRPPRPGSGSRPRRAPVSRAASSGLPVTAQTS